MEKDFNKEILNSLAEGVLTVDKNFKINFFNRAAESITGYDKDEVIGQFCKYVFKCELCQTQCPIGLVLESGNDIYEYNSSIEIKNGPRKPIRLNAAILKNSSSEPVGGVISFRDLSELIKLRREAISPSSFYGIIGHSKACLLYTSEAADERSSVDLGGRRIIKKKKNWTIRWRSDSQTKENKETIESTE